MVKIDNRNLDRDLLEILTALHQDSLRDITNDEQSFKRFDDTLEKIRRVAGSRCAILAEAIYNNIGEKAGCELAGHAGFDSRETAFVYLTQTLEKAAQNVSADKVGHCDHILSDYEDVYVLEHQGDVLGLLRLDGLAAADWKRLAPVTEAFTTAFASRARRRELYEQLDVFKEAFEATAEGYVIYDPEDRLYYCNAAYKNLYDKSRHLMKIGARFEDILRHGLEQGQYPEAGDTPEEHEFWLQARLMVHRRPTHSVIQRIDNDRWLKIEERKTERGYTVGVRADVTEIKQNEEALRKSEMEASRLALVASKTNNSVIITNEKGTVEWVNDAFTRITGYTSDEIIGKKPGELLQGPGTDPDAISYMRSSLAAAHPFKQTIFNYDKSGKPFWNQIEVQPIFDDEGHLTNFIVIEQDVTREKTSELALKRSELKFRYVVDMAPVGILQTATDGRFVDCNETFQKLSFSTKNELISQDFHQIFAKMPAAEREDYLKHVEEEGRAGPVEVSLKSDVRESSVVINSLIVNIPGSMPIVWTILQDITERKRIERLKSEFISVVSHELRTPITAMIGSIGLLEGGVFGTLSEKQAAMLKLASSNAARLKTMVDDILDSEKIENGNLILEPEEFDLIELLSKTVEEFRPYCADREISVEFSTAVPEARTVADRGRIEQIILNLLSNAAKFSADNSAVTVALDESEGNFRLTIADEGAGIPSEALPHLFDRFYQVDGSDKRSRQGTGLGLSICQAIAKAHGAEIEVESEVGCGSTFRFNLPRAA